MKENKATWSQEEVGNIYMDLPLMLGSVLLFPVLSCEWSGACGTPICRPANGMENKVGEKDIASVI